MNLPADFTDLIYKQFPAEAELFLSALDKPAKTSVRINPEKPTETGLEGSTVPWCSEALVLTERPSFIHDPLFHAGAYYVQESSGMFLKYVLEQLPLKDNASVLDLCAAPGGKSTLLLSCLPRTSHLVSNEIIKSRIPVLAENLLRWGQSNYTITNNDPAQFGQLKACFDLILVDAPCSGEGLFRRDAAATNEWSADSVASCAARQQRILADVLPALKPGGFLLYSTCTFNETENDGTVNWLLQKMGVEPHRIEVPAHWQVVNSDGFQFRFLPHKVDGEGLFIAVLKKPGEGIGQAQNTKKAKLNFVPRKQHQRLMPWLNEPEQFDFIIENDLIYTIQKNALELFGLVRTNLYVRHTGICMGRLDKNSELIPEHSLALSVHLSSAVPSIELDQHNALQYLRKEGFEYDQTIAPGWYVVRYKSLALGWIKAIPGRINNYLPASFRILN